MQQLLLRSESSNRCRVSKIEWRELAFIVSPKLNKSATTKALQYIKTVPVFHKYLDIFNQEMQGEDKNTTTFLNNHFYFIYCEIKCHRSFSKSNHAVIVPKLNNSAGDGNAPQCAGKDGKRRLQASKHEYKQCCIQNTFLKMVLQMFY